MQARSHKHNPKQNFLTQAAMIFPKIFISAAEQTTKFRYYSLSAIYGIKLISTLSDEILLRILTNQSGEEFEKLRQQSGPKTNPNWVVVQVAEALYERGTINERQLQQWND